MVIQNVAKSYRIQTQASLRGDQDHPRDYRHRQECSQYLSPRSAGRRVNGGGRTKIETTHKVVTTAADRLRIARVSSTKDTPERGTLDAHKGVIGGGREIESANNRLDTAVTVLVES